MYQSATHIPYFDDIRSHIINELENAESSIKIAVSWFNNRQLFNTLNNLLSVKKTLTIEVITTFDVNNCHPKALDFQKFISNGGHLYFTNDNRLMHNKFCIVDGKTLINGSYNWTKAAESNLENIIIHKNSEALTNYFIAYFDFIKKDLIEIKEYFPLPDSIYNVLKVNRLSNDHQEAATLIAKELYEEALELRSPDLFNVAQRLDPFNLVQQQKAIELNLLVPAFLNSDIRIKLVDNPYRIIFNRRQRIPCSAEQDYYKNRSTQAKLTIELFSTNEKNFPVDFYPYEIKNLPESSTGEYKIVTKYSINASGLLYIEHLLNGNSIIDFRIFDLNEKKLLSN